MFPLLLKLLNPKQILTWGPWALLIALLLFSFNQHQTLRTERARLHAAEVALQNPKTVEVIRVVRQTGPVRIVERVIERPSGERETTRETTSAGETVTENADRKSTPVPVDSLVNVAGRTDRWLLGAGLRNWETRSLEAYTLYGGYSWKNRLDLMAGAGRRDGSMEGHLLVVGRF